jgi:serine/threonine-protein kinase
VASLLPAHHLALVDDLLRRLESALGERYRLADEIGRGGMAIVYLAEDVKHHRRVAIKVLRPELAQALGAERFLREIEIAARLTHPHILALHDSGEADGLLYYVMPYVEGESLRDRLSREHQLPVDEALRIATQVASALGYAHSRDVVHRDIKPENILLAGEEVLVADFGIARLISAAGAEQLTSTGFPPGTPLYMSPEQGAGEKHLDGRSDLYSLGCVLYEMLAGSPPFTGPTAQAIQARRTTDPVPPLRTVRETVPVPVEQAIFKALAKVPADRFTTAAQFSEALETGTAPQAAASVVAQSRPRKWLPIAALGSLVALATALWVGVLRDRIFRPATDAAVSIKVAVLPFANLTGDPAQEYFSDGLTEEMITELGRLHPPGLAVIARTSAMQYKRTDKPAAQIGRELGVQYILEGSTQREKNHVRISARLIRVRDQTQLWADSYDRELTEILSVQSAVAEAVARSLSLALLPGEQTHLAAARRVDPEAFEAYLRGISYSDRLTKPDLETALHYFAMALQKDSTYALAYVGIAAAWGGLQQMGFASPREAQPRLKEAASRALALDSTLAEAHYYWGVVRFWTDWDWSSGDEEFRTALRLNPNFPEGRAIYAHVLMILRRPQEAMQHIERALELDPFNPFVRVFYAVMLAQLGRHAEALEQFRRVEATVPNMPIVLVQIPSQLHFLGRDDEALVAERASWTQRNDQEMLHALDEGAAAGGYPMAMHRIADLSADRARVTGAGIGRVSAYYLRAGDSERALEWLERAYEAHDPSMPYIGVAPINEPLRKDPRFQSLIRRMNLPP